MTTPTDAPRDEARKIAEPIAYEAVTHDSTCNADHENACDCGYMGAVGRVVEDITAAILDATTALRAERDKAEQWGAEVARENVELKAERDAAMQYLEPAALTDREGAEIPTTLVERARLMSMIFSAEMAHQRELKAERDRLREALTRYGEHRYDCHARPVTLAGPGATFTSVGPCNCGLAAALKEPR